MKRNIYITLLWLFASCFMTQVRANVHFTDSAMVKLLNSPTAEKPYILLDVLYFDAYSSDSYFTDDKADGEHPGAAVWVDGNYICSPTELTWNAHQDAANDFRKKNNWTDSVYVTDYATIRFFDPRHEASSGAAEHRYRIYMYIFLKAWETGAKHSVRIGGYWKINNNKSYQWEEVTISTASFTAPDWKMPTAKMSQWQEVSVSGELDGHYGDTTVGLYTKSTEAPPTFSADMATSAEYRKGKTSFEELTTNLSFSNLTEGTWLPVQYSVPLSFSTDASKEKMNPFPVDMQMYKWFRTRVYGYVRPQNVTYKIADQWNRKVELSWDVKKTSDSGGDLSATGTWTVRNETTNEDVATGINYNTRKCVAVVNGYSRSNTFYVYFVPKGREDPTIALHSGVVAKINPSWNFNSLTAEENEDGKIALAWSHNAIGDASATKPYTLHIQRCTDYDETTKSGSWDDIASVDIKDSTVISGTYIDGTHLEPNTTYYHRLTVHLMERDWQTNVEQTRLGGSTVTGVTASRGTYSNMVKVQWTVKQVGDRATNFYLQRHPLGSTDEQDWMTIFTTSGTATTYSYDDVTALPGSFNEYKVVIWSQDGDRVRYDDAATTDGFSIATGIVSGNISYGTGTAVEGAKVTLRRQDADGDAADALHSVHLKDFGAGFRYDCDLETLRQLFAGDFSVQLFVNPDTISGGAPDRKSLLVDVYNTFGIYLRYAAARRQFIVGVQVNQSEYDSPLAITPGEWSHLSIVHSRDSLNTKLYVMSGDSLTSTLFVSGLAGTADVAPEVVDSVRCISIGNDATFKGGTYFNGYLDEFRFFTRALSERDIKRNFNHPLSGNESGLAIYYPFDEGLEKQTLAYDFSRRNGVCNGRHATALVPAATSNELPGEDYMSLMAYTDTDGYFEVRGVPFSGEGSSYSIIPTLGIHEFSPATRSRFFSLSSLNHSGVDFEDVSSFPVSGKVFYDGTDYPVEGVNFYVDGVICSRDGEVIATNEQGEFTISVPIGDHFISVRKSGHEFVNDGRYPADPNGVGTRVNFNQEIKNLEFLDATLVNFTGRVAGGDIEGGKAVGFGLSNNNIGVTELVLTPLNETPRMNVVKTVTETSYSYDTNTATIALSSATPLINSKAWRGAGADHCRKLIIHTDSLTGEFSALVPPLEYKLAAQKVIATGLEVGSSTTVDLSNPQMEYSDTLYSDDGESYELYTYNTILRQAYHSEPTFKVWQADHENGAFGVDTVSITDAQGKLLIEDIYRIDEHGTPIYKYGGAVFEMYDRYTFNIEAYEEYVNSDARQARTDHVPLKDIVVTIDNALSDQQPVYTEDQVVQGEQVTTGQVAELKSNQLALDSLGCATYEWNAGIPNITAPYTRTISISYEIGDRTYLWSGSGMTGIVLGDMPTGNNFVTAGPDMLNMILRDPPGSRSSAQWTSGTIISETHTKAKSWDEQMDMETVIKLGAKVVTAAGMGVAAVSEAESVLDTSVGITVKVDGYDGDTWGTSLETTKTVSTSDDPLFVGAKGDVFIGSSTNILYGKARNLGFHRVGGTNEAALGVEDNVTTGMKFSTLFNYTQSYIETTLIPNLMAMRNSMLQTVSQETIDGFVNTGTRPVYLTTRSPGDPGYGAQNDDNRDIRGNIIPSSKGSSYTMFAPKNTNELYQDSVMWCNSQIGLWQGYLATNEREKVSANNNRDDRDSVICENYSFDSGTRVTNSVEKRVESGTTYECNSCGKVIGSMGTGAVFNGFGTSITIKNTFGSGDIRKDDENTTEKAVFAYTLAEDSEHDALTVDVYDYGDFGPIFRTRGGQTSAPYEGKEVTKYYKPGTTIMEATMQVEVPQIDVDVPVVTDIPSGSTATYTLRLSNASEADVTLYYRLMQAEETNPYGAQLTVDGKAVTDERLIKIPAGETVNKTLLLKQSDLSILDYEGIGIVLASESQYQPTSTWDVIADTVFISAHYVPSSSPVTLALSNELMNTQTGTDLVLTMKDFDRTYRGLKAFRLQYKKEGATDWTQIKEYVLDEADLTANNALLPASGATVSHRLDMASFTDGDYLFRVVSASSYGADEVLRYSDELLLVKDMQRPVPLGQPEPSDGILDIGDELSITFNEPILKGELTKEANFRITGVLNGAPVDHETAVALGGTASGAGDDSGGETAGRGTGGTGCTGGTEAAINLGDKDFSIDAWVNITAPGTLISHGTGSAKLTVGTDTDNHLVVGLGTATYTSTASVPTGKWAFLSMSYKAAAAAVDNTSPEGSTSALLHAAVATDAEETALFTALPVVRYEGNGPLRVGGGAGNAMHDLLLWDEAHDMTTALLNRSKTKSPATRHLMGYWKMNEGEGTTVRDYARNRHITLTDESWYLNNENKAVDLDGQSYMSIDASELPTCVDDDYAVELWMRGSTQTAEAQLLQMGDMALWMAADGTLQLTGKTASAPDTSSVPGGESAGRTLGTTSGCLTDGVWHHIALNVLRQGAAAVYVDGRRCLTTNATNVGSIATNELIVGARRITVSQEFGTYAYDRPFTGQVDEVRVWNATLNGDQLTANRKVRLTGGEPGLVAYYPFERKTLDEGNQVITVGDDADLALDESGRPTGHAAQITALSGLPAEIAFTDNAPSLKTKPTETNVAFTYAASNEKVVITLDEDPATLEGCTLNVTVLDVRDENGNYSLPATWSTFVNRNELVWKESSLSAVCSSTTATTLTATIVNKSGTQQLWTLSGLPAWLTATADYGSTAPLAETEVTFTVSSATPIGSYEETIYLMGNNGIETPLTLHVTVTGDAPYWTVNPNDFETSMNVIASLQFISSDATREGSDPSDLVAAFIGDECRGVAQPVYSERYDRYFLTMDIYGNDGAEDTDMGKAVTFRAYDASTGTLYPVVTASPAITFKPLALEGSYAEPVILTAEDMIEQNTDLAAGWNWMSFYITAEDMTVESLFADIADDVLAVKSQTSGYVMRSGGQWHGDLTGSLSNAEMYSVQMKTGRRLSVTGRRVTPADCPIALSKGWNWTGYYCAQVNSVADALADMSPIDGDIVKGLSGMAYFDNYEWAGSLTAMTPGAGYMVKSGKDCTFTYPAGAAVVHGARKAGAPTEKPSDADSAAGHGARMAGAVARLGKRGVAFDPHAYYGTMIMALKVKLYDDVLTAGNITVAAYAGDELRGVATAKDATNPGMVYLTVYGDTAPEPLRFRVTFDGDSTDVAPGLDYSFNGVVGTPDEPYLLDITPAPHYAGIKIHRDGEGRLTAVFDGASEETVAIPDTLTVDYVAYDRLFVPEQYAAVILPFNVTAGFTVTGGEFYRFDQVVYEDTKWVVTMRRERELEANMPYLFIPTDEHLIFDFSGSRVALQTEAKTPNTKFGWSFIGTYEKKVWTGESTDYGYPAGSLTPSPSPNGEGESSVCPLQRFTAGDYILPLRCYLSYTGENEPAAAPTAPTSGNAAARRAPGDPIDLPDYIEVRLLDENGNLMGIDVISRQNDDAPWFDLNGLRYDSQPVRRGLYIRDGKKTFWK